LNLDRANFTDEFVTITDVTRTTFSKHPWTLAGGGAIDVFTALTRAASHQLDHMILDIGASALTRDDDVFVIGRESAKRLGISAENIRPYVSGEDVRDWSIRQSSDTIWPYDQEGVPVKSLHSALYRYLWRFRNQLRARVAFGLTQLERGLNWYEYSMLFRRRYNSDRLIVFSNISTHNHFAFSRGRLCVFNAHAPVIVLKSDYSDDEYLFVVTLLNSSVGCFWIKQVSQNKGTGGIGGGIATEAWELRYEYDSAKIGRFPIPAVHHWPLSKTLQECALELSQVLPAELFRNTLPKRAGLESAGLKASESQCRMVGLQEELDWYCYRIYGLIDEDVYIADEQKIPSIRPGERAFEIVMARKIASGDLETEWFNRHASVPTAELPKHWSAEYRDLVNQRITLIESNPSILLIEQPEYKRRWNLSLWNEQQSRLLRDSLLARLEHPGYWSNVVLTSCAKLADYLQGDTEFQEIAELYRQRADFDLTMLIEELVESAAVPLLPILRYTVSGSSKRLVWERTWELQRREDTIDAEVQANAEIPDSQKAEAASKRKVEELGDIPIPPKYDSKDFQKQFYWFLGGKLDVPKERFISFPFCERDADQTPVLGWAGWDYLQQAQAIAAYYERVKTHEGWTPKRRLPLLAGILELLPWLKQWHNDIHPVYKERMGDFFRQFVEDEARGMEVTVDEIRAWTPPVQSSTRERKKRNR
jgi:hypothetical protein